MSSRYRNKACLLIVILLACGGQRIIAEEGPAAIAPKADGVLRSMSEYFAGLNSFTVDLSVTVKVEAEGMEREITSHYDVAMRRPNLLRIAFKSGMMGASIISDGEKVYTHLPMLNKYTVSEAPETLERLLSGPGETVASSGMQQMLFVGDLLRESPYEALMDGVTEVEYLGTAKVEGAKCHHIKLIQERFDWELWVDAGDAPLVRRFAPDLSKLVAQAGEGTAGMGVEQMKMDLAVAFNNWQVDLDIPDKTFVFEPPAGAKRVEGFFEAYAGAESHPLLGKQAPDFTLPLLEEGRAELSAHKGKNIVILDFWATWCGPCVKALPVLAEVAEAYEDRGVVFYAVNQREAPETIRNFLKAHDVQCAVALDRDGEVAASYGVEGIPQTVVIGKDGTVQAVHVGMLPNLRNKLEEELEALLAGKDLAARAKEEASEEKSALSGTEGLREAWSAEGRWFGVAEDDREQIIYVVSRDGRCIALDVSGEKQGEFRMPGGATTLRAADLIGEEKTQLIAYGSWGSSVGAYATDGSELWSYQGGQGVNDVCAFDLSGDGLDEVIIGYNGLTGLHVLDHAGKPLWKYTKIGNVWNVSAGDVTGDGKPEVVTTSAMGKVHVFDATGRKMKDLSAGFYANLVRTARSSGDDSAMAMVAGGTAGNEAALAALGYAGNKKWSIELPTSGTNYIDSAQAAPGRAWLAVAMRGGRVCLVNLTNGEIIGHVSGQGMRAQVGWLSTKGDDSPLLVVATGRSLNAFRVETE